MDDLVELELPPRADILSLARLVVAAAAAGEPLFDEERLDDLRLAVSEACTNAVEAQLDRMAEGGPAASIEVRCRLEPTRVEVEVVDHAGGFDAESLPTLPVSHSEPGRLQRERGLGIPLMRLLSDRLELRRTDDGTAVVMVFEPRPLPDPHPVA